MIQTKDHNGTLACFINAESQLSCSRPQQFYKITDMAEYRKTGRALQLCLHEYQVDQATYSVYGWVVITIKSEYRDVFQYLVSAMGAAEYMIERETSDEG